MTPADRLLESVRNFRDEFNAAMTLIPQRFYMSRIARLALLRVLIEEFPDEARTIVAALRDRPPQPLRPADEVRTRTGDRP